MLAFELFYVALLFCLSIYGIHRYWLTCGSLRWRHEPARGEHRSGSGSSFQPSVLVQLPLYNEGELAKRLIDSAACIAWERDRLHIQVLDDSDDGSSRLVANRVQYWRGRGVRIDHVRRGHRSGFKAGALAAGLAASDAEFVAIFDADFVIPRDFLERTIPHFRDPELGMVQGSWSYLNEKTNLLTKIQAVLLDGHFHVEHRARAAAGRFFNFNGTAGVWRRAAIFDAGGWRSDTLTEDLDLSLRAWLRGWRFLYLDDLSVASELPADMAAFKIQQNRWVSGSMQTACKNLARVFRSDQSWTQKLDLFFYLTGNLTYVLLFLLTLAVPVAALLRLDASARGLLWSDVPFLFLTTLSVFTFYARVRRKRPVLPFFLGRIPILMALGLGMSLHNSRAVLRGALNRARVFERTPKHGGGPRSAEGFRAKPRRRDLIACLEPILACYFIAPLLLSAVAGTLLSVPFLGLFLGGYSFVALQTGGFFGRLEGTPPSQPKAGELASWMPSKATVNSAAWTSCPCGSDGDRLA